MDGRVPGDDFGGVEVLLVAGRSGVGKTSVGYEMSELLQAAAVAHWLIDGDNLDAAYPKPATDPNGTILTEANLRALWGNYTAVGYHRLIYVNTVSVLEHEMITRALGGAVAIFEVLLTATEQTVRDRLTGRERGSALETHLQRSALRATDLDARAASRVIRVPTDGRSVGCIAAEVLRTTSWLH